MVGPNPIVLVGTKMDLLPEKAHPRVSVGLRGTASSASCQESSLPLGDSER